MPKQSTLRRTARQGVVHQTPVQKAVDKSVKGTEPRKNRLGDCVQCGEEFDTKFKYKICYPCLMLQQTKRQREDAERVEMAKLMNDLAERKKAMGVKW